LSDQTKRHCMIVHAFYPLAETRVQREAEALIDQGYQVDVLCLRGSRESSEAQHCGVHIYRLPVTLRKRGKFSVQMLNYLHFFLLAMIKLTLLHRRYGYHSIQVHNLPDFLVFCAWLPKLQGVPVILDLHDLMPEFFAARTGRPMSHWFVRLVVLQERLACRFADHIITVTELWRQALIERGVPAHKVSVVMNVADGKVFRGDIASLPSTKNDQFHIIYHGTQTYRYGIDLLLHAADHVRDRIPEMHLTIHGSGDYTENLLQLANQLELGDRVTFSTTFVSLEDLSTMIRSADVGVVPYRRDIFTDGILPTKLLEYVALGVPVIAARIPAIEAHFDETMVEYFTPENVDELASCILKLYYDSAYRATLAKNANDFNQQYNWLKLSAEYVELINNLVTRKNHAIEPSAQCAQTKY
jgi:glycosyltransferase involved in cell wall biosynthesis